MVLSCPNRSAARWSTSFFGRRLVTSFTSCLASRDEKQRAMPADFLVPADLKGMGETPVGSGSLCTRLPASYGPTDGRSCAGSKCRV